MADTEPTLYADAASDTSSPPDTEPVLVSADVTRLQEVIENHRDIPPSPSATRQLALVASDIKTRIDELVTVALADPAIVVRLMRIVNGTSYQTRDRSAVVSMTRAIALMGHDATRAEAESLRLLTEKRERPGPMAAMTIAQATFASRFAHNLLDTRNPMVSDEGAVTTALSHIPAILLAMHAPHEVCALRYVHKHKPALYEAIYRELIGLDETEIQRKIAQQWSLPKTAYRTINRSTQRHAQVMNARDWLPIAVGIANEVAACLRLEFRVDRDLALVEIVRRHNQAMDIDTPRLEAMIELSADEAIKLEKRSGLEPAQQFINKLLTPFLTKGDHDEKIWTLPERLDITGVIGRVHHVPRTNIYTPRGHSSIAPALAPDTTEKVSPEDILAKLQRVQKDIEAFVPHYDQAEEQQLYFKTERLPGESQLRVPDRFERTTSRVGTFLFDGLQMAMDFNGIAFYAKKPGESAFHCAWVSPEPTEFDAGIDLQANGSDLISKAADRKVDAHIANCTSTKVQEALPEWFRLRHPHCRSFVFLPLTRGRDSSLRGFLVAERHHVDTDGISPACMEAMRKLRDTFNAALDKAEQA